MSGNTHLNLEAMNFLALSMRDMAADGVGAEGRRQRSGVFERRVAQWPLRVDRTRKRSPNRSLNRAPAGRNRSREAEPGQQKVGKHTQS